MFNIKVGAVALAICTIAGATIASTSAANARGGYVSRGGHYSGGYGGYRGGGGYYGGGRGYGIGAGVVTGLALGALGAGYGYGGYPYYGGDAYAYGAGDYAYGGYGAGDCWIQRQYVVDQFGYRHLRRVQVCN